MEDSRMEQTFLTSVDIVKVRHLQNITIPLSMEKRKHLIFTGKNGNGKTSVLDSLSAFFSYLVGDIFYYKEEIQKNINILSNSLPNGTTEEDKRLAQQYKKT